VEAFTQRAKMMNSAAINVVRTNSTMSACCVSDFWGKEETHTAWVLLGIAEKDKAYIKVIGDEYADRLRKALYGKLHARHSS
jgi:hypothetical protein